METITPTGLAEATGISLPYASQIIGGKRSPARPLAIHIMRKTGWRHPMLSDLTEAQIEMLEAIEPYRPAQTAA
jgi:plasmid maintenance system antidote protein VapI